jgi:hypothetical protein
MNARIRSVSIAVFLSVILTAFAVPAIRGSAIGDTWTVLVYLDGDNNLDPDSVNDIAEMQMVGSTDKVKVLVLWDRYDEPAYLYEVTGSDEKLKPVGVADFLVNGMKAWGQEVSMADWHVLEAFVDYGKANYPADHFMLDLWDHGNAFGYTCWDDHADLEWKTPARAISLAEVGKALEGFGNLDILTYDGCTIGMVEIAYNLTLIPAEMDVKIGYLVASEEYIPNSGYAYDQVLGQMNSMKDTSAGAVARMLADEYAKCYSPKGQAKGSSTVGLSVIDLSKIGAVAAPLKALTAVLQKGLSNDFAGYKGLISAARGKANLGWSLNGWDKRVDMGTFLLTLSKLAQDQEVKTLAKTAFDALTAAVYVANTPALQSQSAYGLGVWFPTSYRSLGNANNGGFGTLSMYSLVFAFSEDVGWMKLLYAYWGRSPTA